MIPIILILIFKKNMLVNWSFSLFFIRLFVLLLYSETVVEHYSDDIASFSRVFFIRVCFYFCMFIDFFLLRYLCFLTFCLHFSLFFIIITLTFTVFDFFLNVNFKVDFFLFVFQFLFFFLYFFCVLQYCTLFLYLYFFFVQLYR